MPNTLHPVKAPTTAAALAVQHSPGALTRDSFGTRRFGHVNWIGVWTLYQKEVHRYLKVVFQTVLAPIITTMLYLTVFLAAFSGGGRSVGMTDAMGNAVAFAAFLPPGLIMMAIINNAFQNGSSSLIIAKVQGSVVDLLMPPLSAAELTVAFVAGAATRGLMVGSITAFTIALFMGLMGQPVEIHSLLTILYFAVMASLLLGAAGTIAGMWAEKFDQLALVTNFVITPLTFLSGTFYSVNKEGVPDWVGTMSNYNPVFFLIDGFRSGFIGASDASTTRGAIFCLVLTLFAIGVTYVLFRRGYKLKA